MAAQEKSEATNGNLPDCYLQSRGFVGVVGASVELIPKCFSVFSLSGPSCPHA